MNRPAHPSDDSGATPHGPRGVPPSFALVWNSIADVIGTAATAALVRRAAKRAAARHPVLDELRIERKMFTPEYGLPESWTTDPNAPASILAFQALLAELTALLRQLTGTIVLHRVSRLSLPLG